MIIKRMRLRNFRQYEGDHAITFADDSERNVTVVEGPNGAGKSGLFMALNWCLYGERASAEGSLLSKGADEGASGFVEVHFRHGGRDYVARRTIEGLGGIEKHGDLMLDRLDAQAKVVNVPNPSQHLNSILPSDARKYFFFDGERIDDLSKPGHESEVTEAVRSVLKLKTLERAVQHLRKAEKDLAKKARQQDRVTERETELIERVESVTDRVRALREQRQKRLEEQARVETDLGDLRRQLSELEEVKLLARRDEELEADISRLEESRTNSLTQLTRSIQASAPAVAVAALDKAQEILDEKRARGEIPSSIRQSLIDDLMKAGECICERELDDAARAALSRRRDVAVSSELEDAVQLAAGRIKALHEDHRQPLEALGEELKLRHRVIDEAEQLQRERDELRQKLKHGYSDTVSEVEAKRERAEDDLRDLIADVARTEAEIEVAQKEKDELTEELKKIEATDTEARRARRSYELAAEAATAAEEILEEFRASARSQIEEATNEVFKSLLWKKQQFEHVKVSEQYTLDVIDRYGQSALRDLSAGERQVLSLAFLIGMTRVEATAEAGDDEKFPFVIDTPLGRISEDVRENVASRLPTFAPQLVLLVTDQELIGKARTAVEDRIGAEYRLLFDDASGTTTIEEVH